MIDRTTCDCGELLETDEDLDYCENCPTTGCTACGVVQWYEDFDFDGVYLCSDCVEL